MIVGGCDIGSTTGKAVVILDGKIILGNIVMATPKPALTAQMAMNEALTNACTRWLIWPIRVRSFPSESLIATWSS